MGRALFRSVGGQPLRSGARPGSAAIWFRMEREVVAQATRIVFVNEQTAERVMAKYPAEWRNRARVVPQGFDARVTPRAGRLPGTGPLRLVYTGRFYEGVRTPDALLDALVLMQQKTPLAGRISVEFVGGSMEPYERRAAQLGLAGVVTFSGRRSPGRGAERRFGRRPAARDRCTGRWTEPFSSEQADRLFAAAASRSSALHPPRARQLMCSSGWAIRR